MTKNARIFAASLAVLGLGAALGMQRGPWLGERLRAPLEQALSKASGRRVSVGGMGLGVSGWLWLRDVGMGPMERGGPWDLSLTAEAVGLRVDLWGLVRGRVDLSSLRAVRVLAPCVFVLSPKEKAPPPGGAQPLSGAGSGDWQRALAALPLPPVPMDLEDGSVWSAAPGSGMRLLADKLDASLEPEGPQDWRLRASGRPAGSGEASMRADLGPGRGHPLIEADVKNLEWPSWLAPPPGLGPPQGRLNGDFEARALPGAWPLGLDLRGRGTLEGVAIQPSAAGRPGLSALAAQWTLQGGRFDLEGMKASYAGGSIQGQADVDLPTQAFGATLTARGADLGVLALSAGAPQDLSLSGAADLDFWAAGALSAPAMSVDLHSQEALWRAHPLTGLDLRASGAGGRWNVGGSLAWDGGKGKISLAADRGGLASAELAVSSLPADWLEAWAGPGIAGRLDGTGDFSRTRKKWDLALHGSNLEVRGASVDRASLRARGDAAAAHLSLEADLPRRAGLKGDADAVRQSDGAWTLGPARLFQNRRLILQARGVWKPGGAGQPDAMDLKVKTAPLDLALLFPRQAPDGWSGSVQGAGRLSLAGGVWSGAFRFSSETLARKGWGFPCGANVRFGPTGVTVTGMDLRHGELAGGGTAPGWSGPWNVDLSLDKVRLAALDDLPFLSEALPRGLSGSASGKLSYRSGAAPRFDAAVDFKDPLPRVLPGAAGRVVVRGAGRRWTLDSLDLSQPGGGSITGSGDLDMSGAAPWSGTAHWTRLRYKGLVLDGSALLSGGAGRPASLRLAPWSLSATALPQLDAAFTFGKDGIEAVQGRWGSGMRWSIRSQQGLWQGSADLSGQDPGLLAGFLLGRAAATDLRLDGGLEGSFASLSRPAFVKMDLGEAGSPGSALRGQAQWAQGGLQVSGRFRALKLGRLAAAARALGLDAPALDGLVSGSWKGSASSVSVSALVDSLVWNKNKLGPLSLAGGWSPSGAWISRASLGPDAGPGLRLEDAHWSASGKGAGQAYSFSGDAQVTNWNLALWTLSADAAFKVTGSAGKTVWRAQCARLQAGTRVWTKLGLGGTWDGRRYTVKEGSRKPEFSAAGSVSGSAFTLDEAHAYSGGGEGSIKGDVKQDGSLDFEGLTDGLPASDLAGIMGWPQTWTGSSWGTLRVTGNLGHARTVVSAKVENGSVQGLPFDLATGYVVQDGNWVYLSSQGPIRMSRGDGTALEVGGRVTLLDNPGPGQGMDVWAKSIDGRLRLFAGLPAIRAADGPLSLKLRFTGRTDDPRVDGTLAVTDGSISPAWLLPPLQNAEVLVQIQDSKAFLQKAEAKTQDGDYLLKVEPADPALPAFVFKDWVPAGMNMRIRTGKGGIPVESTRSLRFVDGVVHPDLVLSGSWDQPALSGDLSLDKGGQDKAVVQWPAQFQESGAPDRKGWFDRLTYDLALKARTDVMVRTGAAEVFVDTGDAGLRLEGAGDGRALSGQIRLLQGSVDYLLATFRLTQDHDSWVEMRGDSPPEVELWGVDDLGSVSVSGGAPQDVQVLLHAWGPLGQVQMQLSEADDPSLTQNQLATLLGMGGDAGDPRSQGGFTRMLGEVPASFLTSWGRKTGWLDEVGLSSPAMDEAVVPTPGAGDTGQVEPLAEGTPVSSTARALAEVSMGKYLGSKLFVGVDTQIIQTDVLGKSSVGPEVGGVVEYQLPGSSKLSVQHSVDTSGQTDDRVMLEGSTSFDNYDPNRRRWDGMATPQASPAPSPSGSGLPAPSPTPAPSGTPGP
ncbi:MAG TPA: translocation/assembly module TamB domain-containing protein [bacterium]|jgi:autotransporter translocation and assembly factor TamB|nr:translocation/assembly module TamB domain-containing protein [bacterium]